MSDTKRPDPRIELGGGFYFQRGEEMYRSINGFMIWGLTTPNGDVWKWVPEKDAQAFVAAMQPAYDDVKRNISRKSDADIQARRAAIAHAATDKGAG